MPSNDVFFDPTGRRWHRIKGWVLAIIAISATLFVGVWGQVRQPPTLAGRHDPPARPDLTGLGAPEVIGEGPLVRLVRIKTVNGEKVAVDPYNDRVLYRLNADDADTVHRDRYAILRYGYSQAAHRTISLTFDDGPDPTWTPKILDVLHKYQAPATFFVVGTAVVRHPELVARAEREGHTVANHTMTHTHLTPANLRSELVPTDRIIAATTGVRTTMYRLPYSGDGGEGLGEVLVEGERLGYIASMEDFDPTDWAYGDPATAPKKPMPLPPTSMDNISVLLHDGGGDRSHTVAYLERLIPWAKQHGYTFQTQPQVSPDIEAGMSQGAPTLWDRLTLWQYEVRYFGPGLILKVLFALAIVYVVVIGAINVGLSFGRRSWYRRRYGDLPADSTGPPVSAVLPAYNEEKVIARTLEALRRTTYPNLIEILVVDDGSTDRTAEIVREVAAEDSRVRLVRQRNSGKAIALNHAFARAKGQVVVTLDADTLMTPSAIGHLVRPFTDDPGGRLGAVAGTVKVGNRRNLWTRWQALEYLIQIGVDRGAQDAMNAIIVVPGACAAWRRDAVLSTGGYSPSTLAEDCDLALELQRQGYALTQSMLAVCHTEAPESLSALVRQRFRWTYGNFQSLWKHRRMILNTNYGWLGMFTLPSAAISMLMPVLFLPFVYVMAALAIQEAGLRPVLVFGGLLLAAQMFQAIAGVVLTRDRASHLAIVPIYRFIAEPLRAYLLYKTAFAALRGTRSRWNKLQRTGTVHVSEPRETSKVPT